MLRPWPTITEPGPLNPVTAMSVTGGFTGSVVARWSLAALPSARVGLPTSVWLRVVVGVQAKVRVALAPTARPATLCVPTVTCTVVSCRVTSNGDVTSWLPKFFTITVTLAVLPCPTELGPRTLITGRSVSGPGGRGSKPSFGTPQPFPPCPIPPPTLPLALPSPTTPPRVLLPPSLPLP